MKNLPEGNDRSVIIRLINKIISGDFEDYHVRDLLAELRDYSDKNSLFDELANFLAHKVKGRNQGKFVECIKSYNQEIKYIWECIKNKKQFDLHKPFSNCLSQFGIQNELLDQNIIIDEIIKTLKNNDIPFDENEFKKMGNKIMFCILLLLHLKTLEIDKYSNEEMPYCSMLYDKLGNTRDGLYLGLYGILNSPEGDDIKIAFPIISTNLLISEYCDDTLFNDINNSKTNNEIICPLEFNNFKLSYSSKSKREIKNAIIFILRDKGNGNIILEILCLKDSTKHKILP